MNAIQDHGDEYDNMFDQKFVKCVQLLATEAVIPMVEFVMDSPEFERAAVKSLRYFFTTFSEM